MCGIFGLVLNQKSKVKQKFVSRIVGKLFLLSESRGKEASGIAAHFGDQILVLKSSKIASELINSSDYRQLLVNQNNCLKAIIGHTRLVTNGLAELNENNQPVVKDQIVTIHNGIIVNDNKLWKKFPALNREYEVDTEIINSLIDKFNKDDDLITAFQKTYQNIEGSSSIACLFGNYTYLLLATNTGSLYTYFDQINKILLFASEERILRAVIKSENLLKKKSYNIKHIPAFSGKAINLVDLSEVIFPLNNIDSKHILHKQKETTKIETINNENQTIKAFKQIEISSILQSRFEKEFDKTQQRIKYLKRCIKCLLPETMPFIHFDKQGVCNYCQNYVPQKPIGEKELTRYIDKYRNKQGKPNCVVAFSGGRDSSFGLHYIKQVLNLNPVAFSYDWGMITDLGRRNQARMCGKLGIEHILISADISKKRAYIRQNVLAWLKRPSLGTIPLFMAGDKLYFHYSNTVKKQIGAKLIIYSENPLEKTDFKSGFGKIRPGSKTRYMHSLNTINQLKLVFYYLNESIKNPSYINSSLIDTVKAYFSFYVEPHDYLYLYKYIQWDEEIINNTLIKQYNWETAPDTPTTWRIGDGTAAFYNYIYYVVAGFSENDTFRSNQIREKMISRNDALKLIEAENNARWESIKWYCDTIHIDFGKTLQTINAIPKLF